MLSVLTFETSEEAVGIANSVDYGLSAAVWSRSFDSCLEVGRKVRAGTIWMITFMDGASELPFGGYRQSGLGRELGRHAVEEYTETKTTQHACRPAHGVVDATEGELRKNSSGWGPAEGGSRQFAWRFSRRSGGSKIMRKLIMTTALAMLMAVPAAMSQDSKGEVRVVHWWTSGGEAAALNVLKENLQKEGIAWKDVPIAGGGGSQAMTALRAMVTAGNVPTAVQMLGFDIQDWAATGVVGNLDDVANKENWGKVIPAALQKFAKYDGHWVAAPVNIHSVNWIWVNKANMDKLGIKEAPKNMDELFADLDKAKAAGIVPLAQGGQPWQEATMFDSVVISTNGLDFYKKAFLDLDESALKSDRDGEGLREPRQAFDLHRQGLFRP